MAGIQIVTPVSSRDDSYTHFGNDIQIDDANFWMSKIESGDVLSSDEWRKIEIDRNSIPWLHRRGKAKIVRLCGMVQDMLDVEFFAAQRDGTTNHDAEGLPGFAERTPLFVSPLPFTTPWFRAATLAYEESGDGSEKPSKRLRTADLDFDTDERMEEMALSGADSDISSSPWPMESMQSDPRHSPAIAKLYYDQYAKIQGQNGSILHLNQIVEFVGIVEEEVGCEHELGPCSSGLDSENPFFSHVTFPTSIPRVHVLWFKTIDLDSLVLSAIDMVPIPQQPPSPRQDPVAPLANELCISNANATALWLSLLSLAEREETRHPSDATGSFHWRKTISTPYDGSTLGCASLNLVLGDMPPVTLDKFRQRLLAVLTQIVPTVHVVDLFDNNHSSLASLFPTKEFGRLKPSKLQMPKGSTLIINAIRDPADKVDLSPDAEFLQGLKELSIGNKIPYVFDGGVRIAFEADVRVIVLSTVSTEMIIPCTLKTFVNDGELSELDRKASPLEATPLLHTRRYLSEARHDHNEVDSNITLSRVLLERAQRDFVERRSASRHVTTTRQSGRSHPSESDFHRWLTLTRLFARSRKTKMAEIEDWERALDLDDQITASRKL